MYIYKKFVGISAYMINAIGVLKDLVFLGLFSVLLYHLLMHLRTANIVIHLTPIVKKKSRLSNEKRRTFLKRRINRLPGVIKRYFS